jgi:hypothetical protein
MLDIAAHQLDEDETPDLTAPRESISRDIMFRMPGSRLLDVGPHTGSSISNKVKTRSQRKRKSVSTYKVKALSGTARDTPRKNRKVGNSYGTPARDVEQETPGDIDEDLSKPWPCPTCDKRYTTENRLNRHLTSTFSSCTMGYIKDVKGDRAKPWLCASCNKRFGVENGLNYHRIQSKTACNSNWNPIHPAPLDGSKTVPIVTISTDDYETDEEPIE